MVLMLGLTMVSNSVAYADGVGDTGGTGQGDIGGTNVYTFSYIYDSTRDAIELQVNTTKPLVSFGNTTSHTYTSPSDQIVLNTQNPRLGNSLDNAIASMNAAGGYNLSVAEVKAALNGLGYYDGGNGIWKMSGGFLTYVSAVKIRPVVHTIHYQANGGSGAPADQTKTQGVALNLSSKKPTRTGYNFGGWSCSLGGTYQPGQAYTHDQSGGTVNMTAIWNPWKHIIHYDANGGSGAPSNQTKTYGSALTLSSKIPSRTGYTFKGWTCSIGGTYQPGSSYGNDQNGGTVTMTAKWKDETPPDISGIVATPTQWSSGYGTVTVTARDRGSGISSIVLNRISRVDGSNRVVASWNHRGTTSSVTDTYTETSEGVFYYIATVTDAEGNVSLKTSATIYLDHSVPVLSGMHMTNTDWTNIAPVISIRGTDYLYGTSYTGSGLGSIVIKDDSGVTVANGISSTTYTLAAKYEGIHTWTITGTDKVGHTVTTSITTKYDITKPGIDGTEITDVINGVTVSGYCQDNIINQHIDDEASRSVNHPNCTSGLQSILLYKVKNGVKTAIRLPQTQATFGASDTHSEFDVYYDVNETDEYMDYYLVIVKDYAGNINTKKLTTQRSLLTWFHTSIEKSSYGN